MDLQKFNIWLTNSVAINPNSGTNLNATCKLNNHKTHPIDSIYVFNGVPLTSTHTSGSAYCQWRDTSACRSTALRASPMATAMPLYVWGDYNA